MYQFAIGNMHVMNVIRSACILSFGPAQINSQMLSYSILILVYLGHKWSEVKMQKCMKICLRSFSAAVAYFIY